MTSETPTQPPAAPESDVSALTDLLAAATPGPWQHFGDHLVWPSERGPAANDPIAGVSEEHQECAALIVAAVNALPALLADLTAARERVRVVEGERDAARASLRLSMTSLTSACDFLLKASGLPADTDDIDLIEETVLGRIVRAESAEAAHAAMVKVLGEYFDFDVDPWDDHDAACPAPEDVWRLHRDLRALLAGGEER